MEFTMCDEIRLISQVAQNPIIYDQSLKDYRNTRLRHDVWKNIANKLNKDHKVCGRVWERLRNNYATAVKNSKLKIGEPESWISKHHDQLESFLSTHIQKDNKVHVTSAYSSENTPFLDEKDDSKWKSSATIEVMDSDLNVIETVESDHVDGGEEEDGNEIVGGVVSDQTDSIVGKVQLSDELRQRVSRVVNESGETKNELRTSGRVRQKVSLDGAVDEDILAEILKEEQDLLKQYRKQKNVIRSDGSLKGDNGEAKIRSEAKRMRKETSVVDDGSNNSLDQSLAQQKQNSSNSVRYQHVADNPTKISDAHNSFSSSVDDIELFCRHIGCVLRSLPLLQKAMAKKELNSVLSHYEIVAAKNSELSNNRTTGLNSGWNMVTSTHVEGLSMMTAAAPMGAQVTYGNMAQRN